MMCIRFSFAVLTFLFAVGSADGQETMFALMRNDSKLADEYFQEKAYHDALTLYQNSLKKNTESKELSLKVARCYYHLKEYKKASLLYGKFASAKQTLSPS